MKNLIKWVVEYTHDIDNIMKTVVEAKDYTEAYLKVYMKGDNIAITSVEKESAEGATI